MLDRLGPLTVPLVPRACAPVQICYGGGLLVHQTRPQHVGKEVVVAIPPTPAIQRNQEQVRSLELLQHGFPRPSPRILAGDGVTQRTAQPVQDGGLLQESADALGLTLQDLFDQVVDNVAVVSGEASDEVGDVWPPLHRKGRQLERGNPAFGALLERCDGSGRQIETHRIVEVCRRLVRREPQLGSTDFDQVATGTQARQRQRRIGPAGDDQMQPRG